MSAATVLTDRFDRALLYATHVHGGQVRKETTIPYIAHLLAVAATVLEYGGSEDMAIAGLLHDAAEDQGGEPRLADIRNRFGDRVADIVHACSDSVVNTAAGQQKEDWRTRKMRYIEHLKTVDRETCLVSLSDKVHNARSILRDLRKPEIGSAVWSRFGKRPKEDTLWYYRQSANAFQGLLPGQLAEELMEIVVSRSADERYGFGLRIWRFWHKIIGPLGLALIVGSSNIVTPQASIAMIGPAFIYLAGWYLLAGIVYYFFGIETKGCSIEYIDEELARPIGPRPATAT